MQVCSHDKNRLEVSNAVDRLTAGGCSPTLSKIAAATALDVEQLIEVLVLEGPHGFDVRAQMALEMRLLEGLTRPEIAERLCLSQLDVSQLLRRALEHPEQCAPAAAACA